MSSVNDDILQLPLHALRVIECGDTIASAYAGRLLADLGADVVKLEQPAGDPLRAVGPFPGGREGPAASLSYAYYHGGKRSVLLEPRPDEAAVVQLVANADVLIRSTRTGDEWISDRTIDEATASNPGLVTLDLSTFGKQSGDRSMLDLLALAVSGLLSLNDEVGPLRYRGELACIHAACDGVLAVLGALHVRDRDGLGQRIDVSAQAATAGILSINVSTYCYTGRVPRRDDSTPVAPWGYYACADGSVLLQITEDMQWEALRRVLGDPEWARDPRYETNAQRILVREEIDAPLREALATRSQEDVLDACGREGVPATRVHTAQDVVTWPQLEARRFLRPIELDGDGSSGLAPGVPWRFRRTPEPSGRSRPAPLGSTAMSAVIETWAVQPRPVEDGRAGSPSAAGSAPEPLDDRRVLDLTWVWAGPFAAMQLAHLGADVVKVESTQRVDVTRKLAPFADDVPGVDRSGYFHQYNQGKRSVTIDPKQPAGMSLVRGLLERSDLVIDNMRPRALARMGLPPEEIRSIAPACVAVALTGFGEDGPEAERMAYGSIIDALAGVAAANGRPGGPPVFFPMSLPDPCAGIHAAIAAAAAMLRARRTGEGDRVELSMAEATLAAFPWPVLIESAGQGPVLGEGNRDPSMSPHGVFAARGEDSWVALVVLDDAEFAALAGCLGRPELADDPRFATLAARKGNEDALEALIGEWVGHHARDEAVELLRRGGVRAEPVLDVAEAVASEPLRARDFMVRHDHPVIGPRLLPGAPWLASRSRMRAATGAPCLGADTASVLEGVLGIDHDQIKSLEEQGVLR